MKYFIFFRQLFNTRCTIRQKTYSRFISSTDYSNIIIIRSISINIITPVRKKDRIISSNFYWKSIILRYFSNIFNRISFMLTFGLRRLLSEKMAVLLSILLPFGVLHGDYHSHHKLLYQIGQIWSYLFIIIWVITSFIFIKTEAITHP